MCGHQKSDIIASFLLMPDSHPQVAETVLTPVSASVSGPGFPSATMRSSISTTGTSSAPLPKNL